MKGNQLSRFLDHGERFEKFPGIPNWNALVDLFHESYMDVVLFLSVYCYQQTEQQRNEYKTEHDYKIKQIINNSSEEINKSYHNVIMLYLKTLDRDSAATDEIKELKKIVERLERRLSQEGAVARNSPQNSPTWSVGRKIVTTFNLPFLGNAGNSRITKPSYVL